MSDKPFDMEGLPTASAQLETMLDSTLWHGQNSHSCWKKAFCALALSLNPKNRVLETMEALPASSTKMDCIDVLNALSNLGNYARRTRSRARDVDKRLMPCLFVPDNKNTAPLVITAHGEEVFFFESDSTKLQPLSAGDTRTAQSGTVWFFQKFDPHRQQTSKFLRDGTGKSWFRALVGRFSATFMHIMFIGLALNIVALAPPIYMMAIYDKVIFPSDMNSLLPISFGVVIALVAEFFLRKTRSHALSWLSARLDHIVGNRIFSHLLALPPELIERASVAAQVARIKTFETVRDLFSGSIFLSFLEAPYVIIALGIIAAVAGPLAVVPVAMLTFYVALFVWVRNETKTTIRLAAKASAARQQFTMETFEKIDGIHANGLSDMWAEKYDDLTSRELVVNFRLGWLGTVAETLAQALTLASAVATIGFGVSLVWSGAISTGALIASMMLVWRVLTPFYSLCTMIPRLEQLRNSIIQVNALMDLETEMDNSRTGARLTKINGRVEFDNLSFRYGAESDDVFTGFQADIPTGSIVAITGKNGSGKTTTLKLIKDLFKPTQGAVRIDGFDIRQLDPLTLRRAISYVPQRPEFFSGTILENMRAAKPLASKEEIVKALKLADAWRDIDKMPDGLETRMTPSQIPASLGAHLSLARGYLHGGPIMLIDELPGSVAHDRAGDYLRRFLDKARGQRTVFIVTQQQDIIDMADFSITLEKGSKPLCTARTRAAEARSDSQMNIRGVI